MPNSRALIKSILAGVLLVASHAQVNAAVKLDRYETCIQTKLDSMMGDYVGRSINDYFDGVSKACRDTLLLYHADDPKTYSKLVLNGLERRVNAQLKMRFLQEVAAKAETAPDDTAYRRAVAAGTKEALQEFANTSTDTFFVQMALGQLTKLAGTDRALRKEMARQVQSELNRVGCSVGEADGLWGAKSRKGLQQFSETSGLNLGSSNPSFGLAKLIQMQANTVCTTQ
ncbi:MAG: hypothetical protein V7695_14395 [Sulfitobacter sp.]